MRASLLLALLLFPLPAAAHAQTVMLQWEKGLIPDEFAMEELGYSPQQIQRILDMREQERLENPEPPAPPPTEPPPLALVPPVPTVTRA